MPLPLLPVLGFLLKLKTIVGAIATFVIDRWRVFLPLAMVAAVLWYVHALHVERDEARQQLSDYQAEVERSMQRFALHNLETEHAAQDAVAQVATEHAVQIALLRRSHNADLTQEQRNSDRAAALNDVAWRDRLRDAIAFYSSAGVPSIPGAAQGPAESGGERDTADPGQASERYIDALELGSAITTADYNACMAGWTKACQVHKCK